MFRLVLTKNLKLKGVIFLCVSAFCTQLNAQFYSWSAQFGGPGGDGANCKYDRYGNIYNIGYFNDSINIQGNVLTAVNSGSATPQDVFICKQNSLGVIL